MPTTYEKIDDRQAKVINTKVEESVVDVDAIKAAIETLKTRRQEEWDTFTAEITRHETIISECQRVGVTPTVAAQANEEVIPE